MKFFHQNASLEHGRRPSHGGMSKTSKSSHGLADLDAGEDDEILKRMEEILVQIL
jgi:hypothetical protein